MGQSPVPAYSWVASTPEEHDLISWFDRNLQLLVLAVRIGDEDVMARYYMNTLLREYRDAVKKGTK